MFDIGCEVKGGSFRLCISIYMCFFAHIYIFQNTEHDC